MKKYQTEQGLRVRIACDLANVSFLNGPQISPWRKQSMQGHGQDPGMGGGLQLSVAGLAVGSLNDLMGENHSSPALQLPARSQAM